MSYLAENQFPLKDLPNKIFFPLTMTLTFSFSSLLSRISTLFIDHYNVLFVHLDALQWKEPPPPPPQDQNQNQDQSFENGTKKKNSPYSKINGQFLFAGLLFFWCFFDGNFLLEYEYTGLLPLLSANATFRYYLDSPYIMFHQVGDCKKPFIGAILTQGSFP